METPGQLAARVRQALGDRLTAAHAAQFPLCIVGSALHVDAAFAAALETLAAAPSGAACSWAPAAPAAPGAPAAPETSWSGPDSVTDRARRSSLQPIPHMLAQAGVTHIRRLSRDSSHGLVLRGQVVGVQVVVKVMRVLHETAVNDSAYMDPCIGARASAAVEAGHTTAFPLVFATLLGVTRRGHLAVAVIGQYIAGANLHVALGRLMAAPWGVARARGALGVVMGAALALRDLHNRVGAVHNDPHLGNFVVAADGRGVVLLDFGRASLGSAVPWEMLTAYPGWACDPRPASWDLALLAGMLVAAQPVPDAWVAMGSDKGIVRRAPALAAALRHFGSTLLPRALQCSGLPPDDMVRLYTKCRNAVQAAAEAGHGGAQHCPVRLVSRLRDPAHGCAGMAPEAWVSDPVLRAGLATATAASTHSQTKGS